MRAMKFGNGGELSSARLRVLPIREKLGVHFSIGMLLPTRGNHEWRMFTRAWSLRSPITETLIRLPLPIHL